MSHKHYLIIEEHNDQRHGTRTAMPAHPGGRNIAARKLTDVHDFFFEIIEEYLNLEESALQITNKIPEAAPEELLADCTALSQRKSSLRDKDEQLISIINLAGRELANTPLIHDYRIAFAKANMACNNLYQRLQGLRLELLDDVLANLQN